MDQAIQILSNLSFEIVPNVTGFSIVPGEDCTLEASAEDPESLRKRLFIPIIVAVAMALLLILLLILAYYYFTDALQYLPEGVSWSYKKYKMNPFLWSFRGTRQTGYYFHELVPGTEFWDRAMDIFSKFAGNRGAGFVITKVSAVYNPTLVANFVGQYQIMSTRAQNKSIFGKTDWKGLPDAPERNVVYGKFQKFAENFSWNDPEKITIVPLCHGTDASIAEKICETGFASLSSLDAGFFGRGIYFTSSSLYTIPYIATHRFPAIIVSWGLLGNYYPVVDSHTGPNSLMGAALKAGYNSHYVRTNKKGEAEAQGDYDEVVIPQESQIMPAYVFQFSQQSVCQLGLNWAKDVMPTAEVPVQQKPSAWNTLDRMVSLSEDS